MAPKADKKVKGKKIEDPPAVRAYEDKETQTEPAKSALKYLCCSRKRNSNPKTAASDSMSIFQRICSWFPCFCYCSKTRGGKSAEQEKPCLCVRNCSDGELAKSIRQLKRMVVQSGQYPLTVAVLSKPQDEVKEELKSNKKEEKKSDKKEEKKSDKKEEKKSDKKEEKKSDKKEEKKPTPEEEQEKPVVQCFTQHHNARCPCANQAVWCEFLRPPRPRKRCRHCNKPL